VGAATSDNHAIRNGARSVLLSETVDELAQAQWPWGEWGKHEGEPERSAELSRLKPNLFTSAEAALALIAAVGPDRREIARFRSWVAGLRDVEGYWLNAAAPTAPGGPGRRRAGFVRNVRHTAKGLDLAVFFDDHTGDDAAVFRWTLEQQTSDGGFPQYQGGPPDPWATAYTTDLLIRVLGSGSARWAPRGVAADQWDRSLRTALDRARGWIVERIDALVRVDSAERSPRNHFRPLGPPRLGEQHSTRPSYRAGTPEERRWEAAALGIEVGSDLGHHRNDAARALADTVIGDQGLQDARDLWALLALWPALKPKQQLETVRALQSASWEGVEADTLEWACRCKALASGGDVLLVQYQYALARHHSSALVAPVAWDHGAYIRWAAERTPLLKPVPLVELAAPSEKAAVWKFVSELLEVWSAEVEDRRGWVLLWDGDRPRDERAAQVSFNQTAGPMAKQLGIAMMIREPETGRGPVDFVFANGVRDTVLVEFKRMDGDLRHGLKVQLPEYLRASNADSAFLVCVGFAANDGAKYERFVDEVYEWRRHHPTVFLETRFIDARRRKGASSS
jgi:hypothetical protein